MLWNGYECGKKINDIFKTTIPSTNNDRQKNQIIWKLLNIYVEF